MEANIENLRILIEEKYPKIVNKNKRFWNITFVPLVKDFLESQKDVTTINESDSPFQVDRCPKCKAMVVYGDAYCSSCGTNFKWR